MLTQSTFKNKQFGAINVAGLAQGKWRRRLSKTILQMKTTRDAWDGAEGNNRCWTLPGRFRVSLRFVYSFQRKTREEIAERILPTSKLMISEVMNFVCSDSCKTGTTKEKELAKGSDTGNSSFSEPQRIYNDRVPEQSFSTQYQTAVLSIFKFRHVY